MDKKGLWPAVSFLVIYTGFLFGGMAWMIHAQISPVKELLTNHITDTNKKIETLSGRIDKLADRFDKMSDRLDRQSDQFGRLYEILIKDKTENK